METPPQDYTGGAHSLCSRYHVLHLRASPQQRQVLADSKNITWNGSTSSSEGL
jgi:hypothetical protein